MIQYRIVKLCYYKIPMWPGPVTQATSSNCGFDFYERYVMGC